MGKKASGEDLAGLEKMPSLSPYGDLLVRQGKAGGIEVMDFFSPDEWCYHVIATNKDKQNQSEILL